MFNRDKNCIVGNCAFTLAVLIYVGGFLACRISDEQLLNEFYLADIIILGIPSMLLLNSICGLKATCAGWWGLLKGFISFIYLAIFTPGMARGLEATFGMNTIYVDVIVTIFHFITFAMIIFPIIGIIRKKKAEKVHLRQLHR